MEYYDFRVLFLSFFFFKMIIIWNNVYGKPGRKLMDTVWSKVDLITCSSYVLLFHCGIGSYSYCLAVVPCVAYSKRNDGQLTITPCSDFRVCAHSVLRWAWARYYPCCSYCGHTCSHRLFRYSRTSLLQITFPFAILFATKIAFILYVQMVRTLFGLECCGP